MIGLVMGSYGYSDLWCWIQADFWIPRLVQYAVPLWLSLIFSMGTFVLTFTSLKKMGKSFDVNGVQFTAHDKKISRQLITHCFIYNFIYWFTYLPGTIKSWELLSSWKTTLILRLPLFSSCPATFLFRDLELVQLQWLKIKRCCCGLNDDP